MKKHEVLEAIQEYLADRLPEEKRAQLEQLIADDPVTAALFSDCRLAYQAIQAAREVKLRNEMKIWDNEKQD